MSPERNEPPAPVLSPRDAESASEVTEFFDRELNEYREEALRRRRRFFRRRTKLSVGLFLATAVSVFASGTFLGTGLLYPATAILNYGFLPLPSAQMLLEGVTFTLCLMGILLAHEMGHYLQAVRHKVPATLPFFIPFPINPFGTMGAVIVQDAHRANRRQLFDIAVSGPLAGLAVALPILWYGVSTSQLGEVAHPTPGHPWVWYGDPLLIRWVVEAIHGPYGSGQDIGLNAPLFAGWVGVFITALNLLPLGQLDGGHILYTLLGKPAHYIAFAILGAAVVWMAWTERLDYAVILVLILLLGVRHPPTADDRIPLGLGRCLLGWLTLGFVVIGFTPTPIRELIPFVPFPMQ